MLQNLQKSFTNNDGARKTEMKQDHKNKLVRFAFILSLFFLAPAGNAKEYTLAKSTIDRYHKVDKEFTAFSSSFYRFYLPAQHYQQIDNVNTLLTKAKTHYQDNNVADSVALLIHNVSTIKKNVNSKSIIEIENILLESAEFNTAQSLLDIIKQESDPSLVSNVLFAFAKYHFSRNDWETTVTLIEKIANDLPPTDYQHAMFMEGLSLQKLRKHREAIKVYKKIPKNSEYYTMAQINMAVSNFRQDWWTDAHIIINKLLKNPLVTKDKELSDRLHTIIGYSFLQLEYFRNSRDAFRNVSLDGEYTHQAIIGIALDAAYQKDYIGALNAARILENKHGHDLESDESHLLLPYFYEKLHQNATASAGYTSAINYYETRLNSIDAASKTNISVFKKAILDGHTENISVNGEEISLNKYLPAAFFRQVSILNAYRNKIHQAKNKYIKDKFQSLENAFANNMQTITNAILKKKAGFITDYMNQCRYGLARMYDNSASNGK